ncbi:hypothetical protein E2R55_22980 [Vibrio vulnificus]|nr:hypothetical protein E2R55_22980 [Vibrio vulnificus]
MIGWKKYATLLPKNWLAKTPQALVPRRLGRQSAERERISEINSNLSTEKLCEYKISHSFYFWLCDWASVHLGRNPHWMEEICDTPAEKLASRDPTDAYVEEAWQTVGGKGADF